MIGTALVATASRRPLVVERQGGAALVVLAAKRAKAGGVGADRDVGVWRASLVVLRSVSKRGSGGYRLSTMESYGKALVRFASSLTSSAVRIRRYCVQVLPRDNVF